MPHLLHAIHSIKELVNENTKFQPAKAFGHTFKDGFKGNLLSVPFIAFAAGSAQRGEALGSVTGSVVGIATYPVFAGVLAAGVAMIPGVNVAAGLIAGVVAMYPNSLLEDSVTRKINWLTTTGSRIRSLELGGKYTDTDLAARARQNSLMELSSASGPMRRYLGNEAVFAHRR